MHEYTVTESLLGIVQAEARRAGAGRVNEVTVVLGELSSFVDDSIDFYFSELSKGTVAEGARLVFRTIEARAGCMMCGQTFRPPQAISTCPQCGSPAVELRRGREIYVDSIDIDAGGET